MSRVRLHPPRRPGARPVATLSSQTSACNAASSAGAAWRLRQRAASRRGCEFRRHSEDRNHLRPVTRLWRNVENRREKQYRWIAASERRNGFAARSSCGVEGRDKPGGREELQVRRLKLYSKILSARMRDRSFDPAEAGFTNFRSLRMTIRGRQRHCLHELAQR